MQKFFNAVEPGNKIGDGTVNDLMNWLEQYVNILFPENAIYYWAKHTYRTPGSLLSGDLIPLATDDSSVRHVACYAHKGNNEGTIIEIQLHLRSDTFKSIGWIKSFGGDDECWMIARAIASALDSLIFYHEIPQIVQLGNLLPRQDRWNRSTSFTGTALVLTSTCSISVITNDGVRLYDADWSALCDNAKYRVDAYLKDWKIVLDGMKVDYAVGKIRRLVSADTEGYTISDRGMEDIPGYYVLPPNGNPLDDSDYIGYFLSAEAALNAARAHRLGQPVRLPSTLVKGLEATL